MTTLDPGASVVLTQGLRFRPRSTAFLATSAAPTMTDGLDVLVQEVIAAMTTEPWSTSHSVPSSRVTLTGLLGRPIGPLAGAGCGTPAPLPPWYAGESLAGWSTKSLSAWRKPVLASDSDTRSWGRLGPAMDGTTVDRSSSRRSEYTGSRAGSCHRPCALAYVSTSATCSAGRPVSRRYVTVSPSIGKIAQVEPNSGLMLPMVARLASGTAPTPS